MLLYLENVDDYDLRINHFQLEGDDMYHYYNMKGANSNVHGYLVGLTMSVWVKQLQSALTSWLSKTEVSRLIN